MGKHWYKVIYENKRQRKGIRVKVKAANKAEAIKLFAKRLGLKVSGNFKAYWHSD